MYQTVGHSGLSSIAAALELPLFTHTIAGEPVNIGAEYGSREGTKGEEEAQGKEKGTVGDETEDLMALLLKVKVSRAGGERAKLVGRVAHPSTGVCADQGKTPLSQAAMPEVTGVACGAILSNYQRVRVEHVQVLRSLRPSHPLSGHVPTAR